MMVTPDDAPDPLNVGQTLTYTAVVTNVQDDNGRDVVLSVALPLNVTFTSDTLHAVAGVASSTPDPSFANNSAAMRTWVNP